MQIVAAASSLANEGGSETYLVTIADHLQRLGHDVWLHAPQLGRASDAAELLGLRIAGDARELPSAPDVLLVQDAAVAYDFAASYPATPQVYVAHSDIFDVQLPPQLADVVETVVVLYDRVERRIKALAQKPGHIVRLTQPVDVERFTPMRPLAARPRVAMTLGNYVHGQRLDLLRRACDRAGIQLRHVGQHGEGQRPADQVLNQADIVFGKARVIIEAMACGRAAYVFDHNGGDGWVTAESYAQLASDNFGGQSLPEPIDEKRLASDLEHYDPAMAVVNRDLAVLHHSATKHAAALAQALDEAARAPRQAPVDAPLREFARLVRLHHRADKQAFALRAQTVSLEQRSLLAEERGHRIGELERQARELAIANAAATEALEAALAAARAEAAKQMAHAVRLEGLLRDVTGSLRWRSTQAVLAPADRLRRAAAAHTGSAARAGRPAPTAPPASSPSAAASPRPASPPPAAASPPPASPPPAAASPPPASPPPAAASPPPASPPPAAASAPSPRRRAVAPPPAPFVVGVARSGTTLLRLQLDAHPDLAIGPETGFGLVVRQLAGDAPPPDDLLDALMGLDAWPDLAFDRDDALRALDRARPWSVGRGLRELYMALAERAGKPRWGDKTPTHLGCMSQLAAVLPEARFIHIIRDGRDVAVSVRGLPFAPGDGSIEAIAGDWHDQIVAARADAAGLAHYREVRFERLVTEPALALRELCEFIELDFDAAMLRAHERFEAVMAALPDRRPEGSATVTRAERLARHAWLGRPPDPARAGRWRQELTPDEVARFEAQAGDLLAELGYA